MNLQTFAPSVNATLELKEEGRWLKKYEKIIKKGEKMRLCKMILQYMFVASLVQ